MLEKYLQIAKVGHELFHMQKMVKESTDLQTTIKNRILKYKEGSIITGSSGKIKSWEEYIQGLFKKIGDNIYIYNFVNSRTMRTNEEPSDLRLIEDESIDI